MELLLTPVIGTIGYFSSWWFVRKIYSSIKID